MDFEFLNHVILSPFLSRSGRPQMGRPLVGRFSARKSNAHHNLHTVLFVPKSADTRKGKN